MKVMKSMNAMKSMKIMKAMKTMKVRPRPFHFSIINCQLSIIN
jgi:hypothetical protein